MRSWTMAVEAGAAALAGVAIDGERCEPIEVDGRRTVELDGTAGGDDDADAVTDRLAEALLALARGGETLPDHVVVVVPGETTSARCAQIAEAAALAGLPDPSWLPDAVARAGRCFDGGTEIERVAAVVDARSCDVSAWWVRDEADGVVVAAGGPGTPGVEGLGSRLDGLLLCNARGKLADLAPEVVAALDRRGDADARRNAAHLRRGLRRARRHLGAVGDDAATVHVGGVAVTIERSELAVAVEQAGRELMADLPVDETTGGPPAVLVVAEDDGPLVRHLVDAIGAIPVVDRSPVAALRGVGALTRVGDPGGKPLRGALWAAGDPAPSDPSWPPSARAPVLVPLDDTTPRRGLGLPGTPEHVEPGSGDVEGNVGVVPDVRSVRDRRRWVVCALLAALLLAVLGAVLLLGLRMPGSSAAPAARPAVTRQDAPAAPIAPAMPVVAPGDGSG